MKDGLSLIEKFLESTSSNQKEQLINDLEAMNDTDFEEIIQNLIIFIK